MAMTNTGSKPNVPVTGALQEKKFTCPHEAGKYKTLLLSIATNLGLGEKESKELVEHVCLIGEQNYTCQKETLTLKIWLSKILVHNCIFRISSSLFSQHANTAHPFHSPANRLVASSFSEIPISFRTVYMLFHSIGFTEFEVSQILNITPLQVRERLSKAKAILKTQRL